MRKQGILFTFLLCFICCILLLSFSCSNDSGNQSKGLQNNTHSFTQLAALSYGASKNQVGFRSGEEIERGGPESFWVTEDGGIYILDTVNSKIKKMNAEGTIQDEFAIEHSGNDIAVDEDTIYVFERRSSTVNFYGLNGEPKGAILTGESLGVPHYFKFTGGKLVMVNTNQDEYLVSDEKVEFGQALNDGRKVKTERTEKGEGLIIKKMEISSALGIRLTTDTIVLPVQNVASINLIGEDAAGDLYIQVETDSAEGAGVDLSVYCYNSSGALKSVIEDIPNEYYAWTAKLLQVTGAGDIYQLLPAADGVKVNVWKKKD